MILRHIFQAVLYIASEQDAALKSELRQVLC